MNDIKQTLAANIQARMGDMTRTALAQAAGISRATICDVLDCRRGCSVDTLAAIANGLGCEPAALLAYDNLQQLSEGGDFGVEVWVLKAHMDGAP